MIGRLNLSDPAPQLTFRVTAKSALKGFEGDTTLVIPNIPLFRWQMKRPPTPQPQNRCRGWGGIFISRGRKCKILQRLRSLCVMVHFDRGDDASSRGWQLEGQNSKGESYGFTFGCDPGKK